MTQRKQVTTPSNRVYKSTLPLKQLKFPEPKKRIKYGKPRSRRVCRAGQDTLTQMDFMSHYQQINENETLDNENAIEERSKKRRKRDGNQPPSNAKYHTQTLTQIEHWSSSTAEDKEEDDVSNASNSQMSLGFRHQKKSLPSYTLQSTSKTASGKSTMRDMGFLRTPQKAAAREIPSSQSPETPHSRASATRSPLKEKSANSCIYFPVSPKVGSTCCTSPNIKLEDRISTARETRRDRNQTTPSTRPGPPQTVRLHVPENSPKVSMASPIAKKESSQVIPPRRPSNYANSKLEILDSEAESDLDDQEGGLLLLEKQTEDEKPETFYGNIGVQTQKMVDGLISPHDERSQIVDVGPEYQEFEGETQIIESQRLSTQHMTLMAPRTGDSDVFISMSPQHITNILDQTKDHEFLQWRLPPSVCRIWIYETSPTCMLKYMAVIGPEKHPNEIQNADGVGNSEFNGKAKGSPNYAYEILELYELADPLPWAQLYANEWLKTPPSKWSWVRPAVLDRLMANLKPALFIQPLLAHDIPPSSFTDTEQAEAQLLDTMMQFTGPALHGGVYSSQTAETPTFFEEASLLSARRHNSQSPRSSQASTTSLSGSQALRRQTPAKVIRESPIQPVCSSSLRLELSSPSRFGQQGSTPILPYSLDSSQLLTRSQMLPESLLSDSVPGPPLFILDSDEEDD
ncbi:hypothetical protein OIDMADRAFT_180203 [Oidiodendron maius Zn]|uniref:Uncharacterized protein n=1 Tax=Oidiodendron maius (strain Zn) TaxID=913774 RepID=A0A0C3GZH0_OIDMZ|nr:hypothetical protein OIDMADRAFT_180203 [Oidiodendron maius Zn]